MKYMLWLVCAIGLAWPACREKPIQDTVLVRAPDIKLDTLDHSRFFLNDCRDRVVVAVFWQTECVPCKTILAALERLAHEYPEDRVVFISICIDPDNADAVRGVVETMDLKNRVLLDRSGAAAEAYAVTAVPVLIVVDRSGAVCFRETGMEEGTLARFQAALAAALERGDRP